MIKTALQGLWAMELATLMKINRHFHQPLAKDLSWSEGGRKKATL